MTNPAFDRATEDVGNIVLLEHVNVTQDDPRLAVLFWVGALGGTRDPYLHVVDANMWINFGRSQIHSPTSRPQVLRGTIGLVMPDLDGLRARLAEMAPKLDGTKFAWREAGTTVEATCPWGNHIRVHAPGPAFGRMRLGMPYLEIPVPRDAASGIAAFYRDVMRAPARVDDSNGTSARVPVGPNQVLVYRETDAPIPVYDGHHIAVYVADFSGPHRTLLERGLVSEESDPCQYRFKDIVDPRSGKVIFRLEHEVRSLTHPMFGRPLVNRNPSQRQMGYSQGHDAFY